MPLNVNVNFEIDTRDVSHRSSTFQWFFASHKVSFE